MTTQKELRYITLDQLVDRVRVDLRVFSGEGYIEMMELIKVVQRCNQELGLQINQTKETILEVEHGRSKLPADFYFLNFALMCYNRTVVTPYPWSGLQQHDEPFPLPVGYTAQNSVNITTCPCWTVVATAPTQTKITQCDGVDIGYTFPVGTSKICALAITPAQGITATTDSFCYNDPNTAQYTCNPVVLHNPCNCPTLPGRLCGVHNPDPWFQNKVYTLCDDTIGVRVIQHCSNQVIQYEHFDRLRMVSKRQASAFSINEQFAGCPNQAMLRNGFIETNVDCGTIYFNYQGVMEDDDGNLMVLNDPIINEYYEWALKERILTNLYINGEPDLERRLQFVQNEARKARWDAMNKAYTPDFAVMKLSYEISRRKALERYILPYSRFFGQYQGISWLDRCVNFPYTE